MLLLLLLLYSCFVLPPVPKKKKASLIDRTARTRGRGGLGWGTGVFRSPDSLRPQPSTPTRHGLATFGRFMNDAVYRHCRRCLFPSFNLLPRQRGYWTVNFEFFIVE